MNIQDVLIRYEGRLAELDAGVAQLRLPHALNVLLLAVAIGLFAVLSLYAIRAQMSYVWPPLPAVIAAFSARRLKQHGQERSRMWRLSRFYDRAVQRVKGTWASSGVGGEEFSRPDHVYANDLGVVGEGSLFELLCIARTSIGQRGLANYLLEPPLLEETLLRQDAVRELRGRLDLREKVATLGEFDFLESRQGTFEEWLSSPSLSFAPAMPIIAAVTSGLLIGIVLTGLLGIIPWINVAIWIFPLRRVSCRGGPFLSKPGKSHGRHSTSALFRNACITGRSPPPRRRAISIVQIEAAYGAGPRRFSRYYGDCNDCWMRSAKGIRIGFRLSPGASCSERNCAWRSNGGEEIMAKRFEPGCRLGQNSRR